MSEQVRRYVLCQSGVVSPPIPWESEGGVEHRDMVLATDYDRVEAKNTALDAALTEVCDERDKYHDDYTRLKARLTTAEKLLRARHKRCEISYVKWDDECRAFLKRRE